MRAELKAFAPAYTELLYENLRFVLDRYRMVDTCRFIDTKRHIITGAEFDPVAMGSPIYGRDIVYGFIQGRGLEALAGHLPWVQSQPFLSQGEKDALREKITTVLHEVSASMEELRRRNRGRVHFMMRTDGAPLCVTGDLGIAPLEPATRTYSYADLFCAKGLYAAGCALRRRGLRDRAERYYRRCVDAIRKGVFVHGMQNMHRAAGPHEEEEGIGHGPFMIALGGISPMLDGTRRALWRETGDAMIRHVATHHVNRNRHPGLAEFDFIECVDRGGRPWTKGGRILCDPGHALEFVGLACKYVLAVERTRVGSSRLGARYSALLSGVARHVFGLGYNRHAGGILKSVDLVARRAIDDSMPWWSLPETMRAAAFLLDLRPPREHGALLDIYADCHDAFLNRYVNKDLYHLAYQTRGARGDPADIIPAVPDADPCYHTGLSIIDILDA